MFHFLLLVSRQGKVRLSRWFGESGSPSDAAPAPSSFLARASKSAKERRELMADAAAKVLQRNSRQCNVIEWLEDTKLVFKR